VDCVSLKNSVRLFVFVPGRLALDFFDPSRPPCSRLHFRWDSAESSMDGVSSPPSASGYLCSALAPMGLLRGSVMSMSWPHRKQMGSHCVRHMATHCLYAAVLRLMVMLCACCRA
jgi:hypothetical protein